MRPIFVTLALLCALAPPAGAEGLSGLARVIDGDGVAIGGVSIRLWGIDAPKLTQTCERDGKDWSCGRDSTEHLRRLIEGRVVECEQLDIDRRGRPVSLCRAGGADLSAAQVEAGMAIAFRRYSLDYVTHEGRAREAKRGIWAGAFIEPGQWRAIRKGGQ